METFPLNSIAVDSNLAGPHRGCYVDFVIRPVLTIIIIFPSGCTGQVCVSVLKKEGRRNLWLVGWFFFSLENVGQVLASAFLSSQMATHQLSWYH